MVTKTGADVVFCKLSIPVKNGYKKLQPEGINEGFVNFRKNSVAGIGTQTLLFKKKVLTKFRFDEEIPRFQDLEILMALCQILLMGHFRRRPVLAPGAAFFQLPFPFDAIGSGR